MSIDTGGLKIPSIEDIDHFIRKKELESSLLEFTRHFFYVLNKEEFEVNWHHKAICDALHRVWEGKTQFLVINIPPRYSKTEIVVKNFIAWTLAKNPKSRYIHLSYSDGLALDNSQAVQDLMMTDEYQEFWPTGFSKKYEI